MKEIRFSQLRFPKGLNLDLLAEVLSERKFREFIAKFSKEKRKDRRIILPSHSCIKKVFFHYLWNEIESGKMSWEQVKKDFRRDFKSLKEAGISKKVVKKLYVQRQKEILLEKIKEQKGG